MKTFLKDYVIPFMIAIVTVFIVFTYISQPFRVDGNSMHPTLKDNQRIIVNKIGYHDDNIKKGDIVVFHLDEHKDLVKRIIAKGGDSVEVKEGTLYINDKEVPEPYLTEGEKLYINEVFNMDYPKVTVPEDYVFVMGDNRPRSSDSRTFGFIHETSIVGRVSLVMWPLDEISVIKE